MSQGVNGALRHCWSMTLAGVDVRALVEAARAAGIDGQDRGAVRRLVWAELGSDAVDHAVVWAVADRLVARPESGRRWPADRGRGRRLVVS